MTEVKQEKTWKDVDVPTFESNCRLFKHYLNKKGTCSKQICDADTCLAESACFHRYHTGLWVLANTLRICRAAPVEISATMVLHKLPASQIPETQEVVNDIERDTASISPGPESSDDDDDQAFSDWISDEHSTPAHSLFDEATFPNVQAALEHDKEKYGFDLEAVCKGLGTALGSA